MDTKEIIVSRRLEAFYRQCYARFGYRVTAQKKVGRNRVLLLERTTDRPENAALRQCAEEKLRMIEIIHRKECGFRSLFLNLLAHIVLFCLQAAIWHAMRLDNAHPQTMLAAGIPIFGAVLALGFCIKLVEIFRWNKTQRTLMQEVLTLTADSVPASEAENENVLSVLFTRNGGWIGELIYWVSGRQYTHASLGLGAQTETFYSFDFRGFRCEHPSRRKLRNGQKDSLCLQFRVSASEYRQVEAAIQNAAKGRIVYNTTGAVLSVLHIYKPFKLRRSYFCSEFVSENLRVLPSFQLKKAANMYLPTNLAKALVMQKNLYRVLVNEV